MVKAEEIANLIVYLLSDEADFFVGGVITPFAPVGALTPEMKALFGVVWRSAVMPDPFPLPSSTS